MSGSKQDNLLALASREDREIICQLLDVHGDSIRCQGIPQTCGQCPEVLFCVARYPEPAEMVRRVCNNPSQINSLQKENFRPEGSIYCASHMQPFGDGPEDTIRCEQTHGRQEETSSHSKLWRCTSQSESDTPGCPRIGRGCLEFRMQWSNALTLVVRAAPAAPRS